MHLIKENPAAAVIPSQKIYYLDHVKVLLTVLVILHHTFITYGGPGGWYYRQPATQMAALIPMTLFVATNQSFFMGLFFMLSAYFIEPSLKRKGVKVFVLDRLKRLGIPLVFYSFIFSPILVFLVIRYGNHRVLNFFSYLGGFDDWIDFGVLWFVAALLLFTLLFVGAYSLKLVKDGSINIFTKTSVLLFALALGAITFLVRLVFPVGWVLHPVGFQLGHFPQYITLFIVGILARRNNLLQQINYKTAKYFAWLVVFMIVVLFPAMFYLKTVLNSPVSDFNGGFHIEAFLYSLWEQVTGISIIVALIGISSHKWNTESKFLSRLSRNAFAVYIFHPLFVIGLSVLVSNWAVEPVIKLIIVAPLAVVSSFLFAAVVTKLPVVNRII